MKLRNPYFRENIWQDQPYSALFLVAPYCDLACPGCHNKELTTVEIMGFTVELLQHYYLSNPFVEGITLAGLEPCLSGDCFLEEFLELIKVLHLNKVTIYSRFTLDHPTLRQLIDNLLSFSFVEDLFLKVGNYQENLPARVIQLKNKISKKIWELKLGSENQEFLILKSKNWRIYDSEK